MKLAYIGLGKMGMNMTERLLEKGHEVYVEDNDQDLIAKAIEFGATSLETMGQIREKLSAPRVVWLMVPHAAVDGVVDELCLILEKGDVVIDGGNSRYTDSVERAKKLHEKGIHMLDAGVSGGPYGARNGACIMVGGDKEIYNHVEPLLLDLVQEGALKYIGESGSGHFVKMVHNGIEYGMMQAIAEGFSLMKEGPYKLNLTDIAQLYNHGSVIESRLIGWLHKAFVEYGEDLESISGVVGHLGEGQWTVETARTLGVEPLSVIEESLQFRLRSAENPSFRGQILSALRNQFGGHEVKKKSQNV